MKYLGIEPQRPKIAVFDFTSCEGCELQLANKEETLVDFLKAVDIVAFREVSSETGDDYDIALVEGAISRGDEERLLSEIRDRAALLVALGSCACFGGVNRMKNAYDLDAANREVYGDVAKETKPVRAAHEVVGVDLKVPGCPICKTEIERIVQHLMVGVEFKFPAYPVCVECKQRFNVCMFDRGQLCLGPIVRAGCDAPCPSGGLGCWGCRGPADDANIDEYLIAARGRGFGEEEIRERLGFFGAFEGVLS